MDRAGEFFRQKFRLIPTEVGSSIQFPRQVEVSPGVAAILEPQVVGIPQSEDAAGDEKATPDVDVATAGEANMDTDMEWDVDVVGKEDYGSDEDRCKAYLKALEVVLERGRIIGYLALTHRKELHFVRAYIQGVSPKRFCSCFKARGWRAVKTLEMLVDWAIEPELGLCNTAMEKLANEIVGAYKGVYYAHLRAEAKKETERIATVRSTAVKIEAREKLPTELVSQQATWVAERVVLLRDKKAAEQRLQATEQVLQTAQAQAMEVTLLLKEAVEVNTRT